MVAPSRVSPCRPASTCFPASSLQGALTVCWIRSWAVVPKWAWLRVGGAHDAESGRGHHGREWAGLMVRKVGVSGRGRAARARVEASPRQALLLRRPEAADGCRSSWLQNVPQLPASQMQETARRRHSEVRHLSPLPEHGPVSRRPSRLQHDLRGGSERESATLGRGAP